MRVLPAIIALTTLGTMTASTAHAQDYKFTVPVQVSKLPPEVKALTVTCEVGADQRSPVLRPIAGTATSPPLAVDATGTFTGDVVLSVNTPGFDPKAVQVPAYRCRVIFTAIDPVSKATFEYFRPDYYQAPDGRTLNRARAFPTQAPPTVEVSGPIPKP